MIAYGTIVSVFLICASSVWIAQNNRLSLKQSYFVWFYIEYHFYVPILIIIFLVNFMVLNNSSHYERLVACYVDLYGLGNKKNQSNNLAKR